jgi:hypothetical protein
MPVFRKPKDSPSAPTAALAGRPLAKWVGDRLPRRIVVFVVVRDESGSMRTWRQRQGEFIPQVAAHLIKVGGEKVGDLVYVAYIVVSGGVVATEFLPLNRAEDPSFVPDGQTPIGKALATVADKCVDFLESRVFPAEVTVRNFEILIVSDLKATGETPEETEAGVEKFLAMAKKLRAKVNLVGPSPEAMDEALAGRLDVSERGIKYLDSDPKAVLEITFDSLLAASRPSLGGSNPAVHSI